MIYVYGILLSMGIGALFGSLGLPGPLIPNLWAALQIPALTVGYLAARWLLA